MTRQYEYYIDTEYSKYYQSVQIMRLTSAFVTYTKNYLTSFSQSPCCLLSDVSEVLLVIYGLVFISIESYDTTLHELADIKLSDMAVFCPR